MQSELEAAIIASSGDQVVRRNRRQQGERSDSSSSSMKKYTKLLLAVTAVISSLCFIIYKYRYDRLYHVMQVHRMTEILKNSFIETDFRCWKCLVVQTKATALMMQAVTRC